MKKILTLLFVFSAVLVNAQTSTWDGAGWTPDPLVTPESSSSHTTDFKISADGYTYPAGAATYVKQITVEPTFSFTIKGEMTILGTMIVDGSSSSISDIGVHLEGKLIFDYLALQVVPTAPKFGRYVKYYSEAAILKLYRPILPNDESFYKHIDPKVSGKTGTLIFNGTPGSGDPDYPSGDDAVYKFKRDLKLGEVLKYTYLIDEYAKVKVNVISFIGSKTLFPDEPISYTFKNDIELKGTHVATSEEFPTKIVFGNNMKLTIDNNITLEDNCEIFIPNVNGVVNEATIKCTKLNLKPRSELYVQHGVWNGLNETTPRAILNFTGSMFLESNKNGSGIVQGQIIETNGVGSVNVVMEAYLHAENLKHMYGVKEGWRELGTPFESTVLDTHWGNGIDLPSGDSFDDLIKEEGSQYIQFYRYATHGVHADSSDWVFADAPNQTIDQPFEVWNTGKSLLRASGAAIVASNSTYSQKMYYYADNSGNTGDPVDDPEDVKNQTMGWNLLPNPSLAYLSPFEIIAGNQQASQLIEEEITVRTRGGSLPSDGGNDVSSTYGYFTIGYGGSELGLQNIAPFQAFWVRKKGNGVVGSLKITPGMQRDQRTLHVDLQKKSADDVFEFLNIAVKDKDGDLTGKTVMGWMPSYDRVPGELTSKETHLFASSPRPLAKLYQNFNDGNSNHILRVKEFDKTYVEGNSFAEKFSMIGSLDGEYSIDISDNHLPSGYNVYLVDIKEDRKVLLNNTPYTFTHSKKDVKERFEIQITTEALGDKEDLEVSKISLANKGNSIDFLMPETSSISNMTLVNVTGQVMQNVMAAPGQTEFNISTLSKGIYVARLTLKSGVVTSFKFVH